MALRRRMLILDGDASEREAVRALLEGWGHEVAVAETEDEAFALAVTRSPGVILLALDMPGVNGHRLAQRIRAAPDGHQPFLIALIGRTRVEDHRKARDAGFDTYLLRPAEPDHLNALLSPPGEDVSADPGSVIGTESDDVGRGRRGSRGAILSVPRPNGEHRHELLLVDDDRDFRETTAAVLKAAGYHAVGAHDGRAALGFLQRGFRPCIILLDLAMPEMDGFVFRRRQLADPRIAGIPVFVVSAGNDVTETDAWRAGMDVFYRKPVDIRAVVADIEKHCRRAA